jgi:threonine dehydrogenase-like Zn-dependent dehydrogenase
MFSAVKFGDIVNKGLTIRSNQCSVKRHWPRLFEHVKSGVIKPSQIITHRIPLAEIAEGYHRFSSKLDNCVKTVVLPRAA